MDRDSLKRYIQQQEVLAIAVGIVIGFALKDFVEKFIASLVTPILDKMMGGAGALQSKVTDIGGIRFKPGVFADATINLFAIAVVVYVIVRVFNSARAEASKEHNKKEQSKKK